MKNLSLWGLGILLSSTLAHAQSASFEVYSETGYHEVTQGLSSENRVRALTPVLSELSFYAGVLLQNDFSNKANTRWLNETVNPMAGLLYRPQSWAALWIEHRERYVKDPATNDSVHSSDPRAGAAVSGSWDLAPRTLLETYAESVLATAWSHTPVTTGFIRTDYRWNLGAGFAAGPYSELYGIQSPDLQLGSTHSEARVGGRLVYGDQNWQASAFVFKPWTLTGQRLGNDTNAEGILVLGGTF